MSSINNADREIVSFNPANQSAFGTLETNELTPVVQLDFVYGINTQTGVATIANSAVVDTANSRLRLQCGTNSAGSAIYTSRRISKYRPGQGMTARFTGVFAAGTASNTQIIGVGTSVDGYFFGYNGTSFGILFRNNGSDTWIPQSTWNGDKADGTGPSGFTWNPQKGNVMMIKYPFLGYGNPSFYVEDSVTGQFILVHSIQYTNNNTATQLSNPNLFFYARNLNSGNTGNLIMYVGSVGIFLSGIRSFIGNPKWATDNFKTGITTETNIFSLINATTVNGTTNRSLIRLQSLAVGCDAQVGSATVARIRLRINATLGGVPSYAPINGSTADNGITLTSSNSIASVDVAATTVAAGIYIYNLALSAPGNEVIDLTPFEIFVAPTEILTVSGLSNNSTTVAAAINWSEDT